MFPLRAQILSLVFALTSPVYAASAIKTLLQENRLEEALPRCRQIEMNASSDKENSLACAWIYFRSDRLDAGEQVLEKQKRHSALPDYQVLTAYLKIKRKKYQEGEKILDAIRTEYKGTSAGWSAEETYAESKELQGDMATAAFIYKQVVGAEPKRGVSQWGLGRYYLSRNDIRQAIQHLENTANYWPKHVGSRFNLALIYSNMDDIKVAAKWLFDCYQLNKADSGVLEEMGNIFEKKGQLKEAVKYWQRALDINKDLKNAKEKLAAHFMEVIEELIELGRYQQAIAKIESSSLSVEERPELLLARGVIYRNLGKHDKAASDLKTYLKTRPKDSRAQRELGIAYLNLGLADQALKLFEKAAVLEPENGLNYAWAGYVLEGKGELKSAQEAWQRAVDLIKDPQELKRATRRLASVQKRLGRNERKKQKNPMEMGLDLKPSEEYEE